MSLMEQTPCLCWQDWECQSFWSTSSRAGFNQLLLGLQLMIESDLGRYCTCVCKVTIYKQLTEYLISAKELTILDKGVEHLSNILQALRNAGSRV
uniref:Uncharacterized protein n=1 Tax=Romanomermis culicivorax TaxID=13658 RepID=A0A915I4E8_ROMCU